VGFVGGGDEGHDGKLGREGERGPPHPRKVHLQVG
jgi:hypothetical protein